MGSNLEESFREDLYVRETSTKNVYELKIIKDQKGFIPRRLLFHENLFTKLDMENLTIEYYEKCDHANNHKNALSFI